ncbi:MAG: SUMF1/EgtB/PvdO family nonheme iron enzyme, partial [Anaerolineales bacterium]|nr:SUMF1/EgtB/PvdO family nonheme iron enzyme [Anaerolineales bacterium]
DIYSLGIILYEMAAGRPPFEGDSAMTIMLKHVNEPVPDIRTRAEVPQALKEVLDRALAKDPADRFQSAADLANSLRALVLWPTAAVDQPTRVPGPVDRAATVIEPVPAATIHEAKPAIQSAERIAPAAQPQPSVAVSGPPVAPVPPAAAAPARASPPWLWLGGLGLAVVVCLLIGIGIAAVGGPALLAALGGASATRGAATRTPEATQIAGAGDPTLTPGAANPTSAPPGPTAEPPTLAPTEAPTGTPEPTAIPVPQGMLLIPGGTFSMGSEAGGDTGPIHAVTLSGFFLDQTEVTNARYQTCVDAGACTPPQRRGSDTRGGYFTDPAFANYPMLNVTWAQADAFCHAEGKRLPTEAEWEYAATGGDGRLYPWGNTFDPGLLPVQAKDTVAVGSFPQAASPFGAFDMAGNALEWVNDWYGADYYGSSPAENPTGPESGTRKVLRGGSFGNPDVSIYITTRRFNRPPNGADVDIGFRCAMPMP